MKKAVLRKLREEAEKFLGKEETNKLIKDTMNEMLEETNKLIKDTMNEMLEETKPKRKETLKDKMKAGK